MRILIAEDSALSRNLLVSILHKYNFSVIEASNGQEAVEKFQQEDPDLVLMDIMMPVMNGYEATRKIKELSGDNFVPIIILSSITETDSLVKSIESGADDYLNKPYNAEMIHAKIIALSRIKSLHETVEQSTRDLRRLNEMMGTELTVAEHIYDCVLSQGKDKLPNVKSYIRPVTQFNGDIHMAMHAPSGALHVMLGDFTGHGLAAAIGAIPASEVFCTMTEKGFSIGDIVEEMNSRLKKLLPVNMFCAACLLEIDQARTTMSVWNGGMPDVVIMGSDGKPKQRIPSSHAALGVETDDKFSRSVDIISIDGDEYVYLCSDGLVEVRNSESVKYGMSRYFKFFERGLPAETRFIDIVEEVLDYAEGAEVVDDISLVEITVDRDADPWYADTHDDDKRVLPPATWEVDISLDADALKQINPVPLLLNLVMGMQTLEGHRERIFTVLSELFMNAMDHGVLKLDSTMKTTPEGFHKFYTLRESRLQEIDEANVTISIRQEKRGDDWYVLIRIRDSGEGFDAGKVIGLADNTGLSGRGIPLIRQICESLDYNEAGNEATAVYCCQY